MRQQYDRTMASVDLRQPWVWAMLFVAFIPVFPEYIAPFLGIGSLMFALGDAKRHHRCIRVGTVGKLIVGYLCFMTLHMIWATEQMVGLVTLLYWGAMFCAYLALTTVLVSHQRIETTVFMISLIAGILGLIACGQYVCVAILHIDRVPLQLWDFLDSKVYGLVDLNIHLHSLGTRAAATFSNPNLFAQYLVMSVPLISAYAFCGKRSAAKILSRISLLLCVMGIFFSFSRGAYLALFAIAIVMCMANIRRLVPILMVAFSALFLLPESIYARLGSMGDSTDVAIVERFEVWGITMDAFFERPLLGHGIGIGYIWERLAEHGFTAPHAHNLFLQFLVEGGIVGLLLLLFLLWKLFRIGFDLIIHAEKTRMYGSAIIAFCGGLCVCGMVDVPIFSPKPIGMFMIMLALADTFSFLDTKRLSFSLAASLPFADRLAPKIEDWIKKKTAPKSSYEKKQG